MQSTSEALVERLRAYCLAKPGIIPKTTLKNEPQYQLLGHRGVSAIFFLDKSPIQLRLRCSDTVLDALPENTPLHPPKEIWWWHGEGWNWIELPLDGSMPEAEIHQLLDDSYELCLGELNEHEIKLIDIADRGLTMLEAVHALIDLNELQHRRAEIQALVRKAILLRTGPAEEADLAVGHSKLGGLPDLPEEWAYPFFDGKALAFLAQINLGEIPNNIYKEPLPATGILYFFSAFGWHDKDGYTHPDLDWDRLEEPGFSQVLYFDGPLTSLQRRARPDEKKRFKDLLKWWAKPNEKMIFKAADVQFVQVLSLPRAFGDSRDPAIANLGWTEEEFNRLNDLYWNFNIVLSRTMGKIPRHQLLGYADPEQDAVTPPGMELLFQLDSDYYDLHTNMMWEDGGLIYFLITPSDLGNADFSRIRADLQCG